MKVYVRLISLFLFVLLIGCNQPIEDKKDLSGAWRFKKDSLDRGVQEQWFGQQLTGSIVLPGSMASNGLGNKVNISSEWTGQIVDSSFFTGDKYAKYRKEDNFKIPFWLQPTHHYIGTAWYQKEITIPNDWDAKKLRLFLERCHWETRVWIDHNEIGQQNSLSTPMFMT